MHNRILVIGGGSIGTRHLNNLTSLGAKNLACLHYSKSKKNTKDAITHLYDWSSVVKWEPEIILICSPTVFHMRDLDRSISLGVDVFMEKPLSSNAVNPELHFPSDRVFMIGYMLRWHNQLKKMRELIVSDKYGRIISASFEFGSYMPGWHPNENYRDGYAALKSLGGGVINTISHEIDLITWYFGYPKTVYTQNSDTGILEIEVEENSDSIVGYENFNVRLHLDFLQTEYSRSICVVFENAVITWDWNDNNIWIKERDVRSTIEPYQQFNVNQLYVDEIEYFMNMCSNRIVDHDLNYNYAIFNQRIITAMHESNKSGEMIILGVENG